MEMPQSAREKAQVPEVSKRQREARVSSQSPKQQCRWSKGGTGEGQRMSDTGNSLALLRWGSPDPPTPTPGSGYRSRLGTSQNCQY